MKQFTPPYLLARLAIGVSLFGHGLVRIPILDQFSAEMVQSFRFSMLPPDAVVIFSYVLPFVELIIGALIITGLFMKEALIVAGVVMAMLIFGTTTIQKWDNIQLQLMHVLFIIILLAFCDQCNAFSLDKLRREKA